MTILTHNEHFGAQEGPETDPVCPSCGDTGEVWAPGERVYWPELGYVIQPSRYIGPCPDCRPQLTEAEKRADLEKHGLGWLADQFGIGVAE